ncbi:hypothetical protein BABINDRAFT_9898 [Babjeviella inositovora NRRL Y-12698]|uniref:PH domain-containing protein n=1 Tax=Babjeviella inositovora NRRL Y-12698 TaxID=984486 RepID=A0A1E3QJR3_9ASCO|nr:uncharacterized protein BABINDRAFT_9898 [Babjeviella inositovora NRRL Y-12698]ODQ77923.1 hypothetical protein BABINDRAFT_9898 [Babjeviella inositovora NRRL Y-12698]
MNSQSINNHLNQLRESKTELGEKTAVEYLKILKKNLSGTDSQELSNSIYLLGKLLENTLPPTPQLISLFDDKFDVLVNHALTKTDKIKKSINIICLTAAQVFIQSVGSDAKAIYHLNKLFKILPPSDLIIGAMDEKFFLNLFKWLTKTPLDDSTYKSIIIIGFKVLDGQLHPQPTNISKLQPLNAMLTAIIHTPNFFQPLNNKLFSQDHRMVGALIDFLRLCLLRAVDHLSTMLIKVYSDMTAAGVWATLSELVEDSDKLTELHHQLNNLKIVLEKTMRIFDKIRLDYDNDIHRLILKDCLEVLKEAWGSSADGPTKKDYVNSGFTEKPHEYILANYTVLNVLDLTQFFQHSDKTFRKIFSETLLFNNDDSHFPLAQAIVEISSLMLSIFDKNGLGDNLLACASLITNSYRPRFHNFHEFVFSKLSIYHYALTQTLTLYNISKATALDLRTIVSLITILYEYCDETILARGGQLFVVDELKLLNDITYDELRKIQLAKFKKHKFDLWSGELGQFNEKLSSEVFDFVREQRVLQLLKGSWVFVSNPLAKAAPPASSSTIASSVTASAASKKALYYYIALSPDRKLLYYKTYDFKTSNKPSLDLNTPGVKAIELKNVYNVKTRKIEQESGVPMASPHLINIISRTSYELISLWGRTATVASSGASVMTTGTAGSGVKQEKLLFEFYVDTKESSFVWVDGLRVLCTAGGVTAGGHSSTAASTANSVRNSVIAGISTYSVPDTANELSEDTANQISMLEDLRKNIQLLQLNDDDLPESVSAKPLDDDVYDLDELMALQKAGYFYNKYQSLLLHMDFSIFTNGTVPQSDAQCELLGPTSLIIQSLMAVASLSTLVIKRQYETPRRPWLIWWFDILKQLCGSCLVHFVNLFGSVFHDPDTPISVRLVLFEGRKKKSRGKPVSGPVAGDDDPCDWYFLNTLFDTTVGVFVLYQTLKLIYYLLYRYLPQEQHASITSGQYGSPKPRFSWYMKQLSVYCSAVLMTKFSIFSMLLVFPGLIEFFLLWCLWWLDGLSGDVRVFFVILVFPMIMNGIGYIIVDNMISSKFYPEEDEERRDGTARETRALLRDKSRSALTTVYGSVSPNWSGEGDTFTSNL